MQRVHMCHYHNRIGAFLFSLAEIQRVHFVIANMFRHIDVEATEKRSKKKQAEMRLNIHGRDAMLERILAGVHWRRI